MDMLHAAGWQVLEEREGGAAKSENVWSLAYIDALVLRDTLDAAAGSLDTTFGASGNDLIAARYKADGALLTTSYFSIAETCHESQRRQNAAAHAAATTHAEMSSLRDTI